MLRAIAPALPPPGVMFLTNHALVLLCVATHPDVRERDLAAMVGITERSSQRIVGELVAGGYLERVRVGRRNRYRVHLEAAVPELDAQGTQVSDLVGLLTPTARQRRSA